MSLFIESIRIEQGRPCLLHQHEKRVARTLSSFFPSAPAWTLSALLADAKFPDEGIHKCRVMYNATPVSVQVESYTIRPLNSLKLVSGDRIDYRYKYANRHGIEELFDMRGEKDDVLIIKEGLLTDTSFGNIALMTSDGRWVTPESYLLAGTMRQHLLETGRIVEVHVPVESLKLYRTFRVINALRGWDTAEADVSNID